MRNKGESEIDILLWILVVFCSVAGAIYIHHLESEISDLKDNRVFVSDILAKARDQANERWNTESAFIYEEGSGWDFTNTEFTNAGALLDKIRENKVSLNLLADALGYEHVPAGNDITPEHYSKINPPLHWKTMETFVSSDNTFKVIDMSGKVGPINKCHIGDCP